MRLEGKKIAVLVEDGFEDLEFWVPVMRLREEGAEVVIAGREKGILFLGKSGLEAFSDSDFKSIDLSETDGILIPGGWAPDKLRRFEEVKSLVKDAYERGSIIGMICHAGLVGISAGIVRGSKAVGSEGIKDDLLNAGANWVDEPAFTDRNLVWGRVVRDIPDFCRELVKALEK
ncbi:MULTISPECIES: type 1 glutamine amidotransferase domain-containing protein [unclassified Mesotoga]|jgi:protease I|uniref:type 1 glutamine amidotransferase domain-containing protein n=1 Tax=unclassified Mesotoga TaxID=1184398 RepID=UPI000EF23024|nr:MULTISPECIES: type 1 glutamine amidotransferase domain-containing protein [unclassified Mesotoga]MDI9367073.1 type 1 glutamine amidotransferase domain-containing protein [Thermotogota bacterium]NLT46187.1 type 1 glutamine amidotransferase [Thermotogaceae bacterium]MDD4208173.1 type 1 glutamine amidotransferase [Mesotoga sp.]MDD4825865.1 type 1 glutamine amidotransferase [Mesotoga sp.]RLL84267.1 glutamine amidotransferase [Mesotoga sp. BH458_6_3_2_1]